MNQKPKIIKICKFCNEKFYVQPSRKRMKFCSKQCHNLWMHKNQSGENSYNWKNKIPLICKYCSKEFKVDKCRKNQAKFCSRECYSKWQSENMVGENALQWQDGISFGKYCHLFNKSFKQIIRNRFHNKCYLCNKSKEDNGRNLDVHHVNYNKNCLCGSSCEFVPLCHSCHIKTNFNRQYWEDLIIGYLYLNRYFMVDI